MGLVRVEQVRRDGAEGREDPPPAGAPEVRADPPRIERPEAVARQAAGAAARFVRAGEGESGWNVGSGRAPRARRADPAALRRALLRPRRGRRGGALDERARGGLSADARRVRRRRPRGDRLFARDADAEPPTRGAFAGFARRRRRRRGTRRRRRVSRRAVRRRDGRRRAGARW